jgi:hypothetical protein
VLPQLPSHLKVLPVGLSGETYFSVLIDEDAEKVERVYVASGDLALVVTAEQLVELANVVESAVDGSTFSLSRHGESYVVTAHGNIQTSITLDDQAEMMQFRAVLKRVKEIIEP